MARFVGSLEKYPARAAFLWYVGVIALGALLLSRPLCRAPGAEPVRWTDAAFTSASATCVTGLIVRSTEHDFNWVGQMVILLLIQLGGVGIMTVTTFVMFRFGRYASLRDRAVLSETLGADAGTADLGWILRNVLLMTMLFEGAGFLLLAARWAADHPLPQALWHALFHSVSAFCNAGFSLNDESLMAYRADPLVNGVVIGLIVCGGIGFPVMLDLSRNWSLNGSRLWERLQLHSKLMLISTLVLLAAGAAATLALEWRGVLADLSPPARVLAALFHSVTCRTAGFNTVDVAAMTNATLFISILLMMIGAGPGSTAGGFKATTVAVLVLRAWTTFRGRSRINLFRRTIPERAVQRATTVMMAFVAAAVAALTILLVLEQSEQPHPSSQGLFLDAAFEVASAAGTVGLSTGMTPHLTTAGRWVIIILMFLGRLGPMSVFVALSRSEQEEPIEYPNEEPMLG